MTAVEVVSGLLAPDGLRFGEPQHAGALTVIPVFHDSGAASYRLFAEVAGGGRVTVEEVNGGSVPHLLVHNRSADAVLLVEGEVLGGLRQTRTLNTTVLVAAHASLKVPVACVEAGRWGPARPFAPEAINVSPRVRHPKNRGVQAAPGSLQTDQGEVWAAVHEHIRLHAVESPTASYADVAHRRGEELHRLVKGLRPVPGQQGVLALVAGRPAALDLFDRAATLASLWQALVGSYATDAIVACGASGPGDVAAAVGSVAHLSAGRAEQHPAVGEGEVVLISAAEAVVSALVVGAAVVHLTVIWPPTDVGSCFRPHPERPGTQRSWFGEAIR